MPDFILRSTGIELMDDLTCSGEVVHQTLHELDKINHLLGGNRVTLEGLHKLTDKRKGIALHIADLGCGSGEMLKLVAQQIKKINPGSTFTGIDANPHIVQYAQGHVADYPEISIQEEDILSMGFRSKKFDVVMATLFFHHFTSEQLNSILRQLTSQVRVGIIINDLHRHWLAYYSIKLLTRFFSNSSMVKYDAPLSVLRGFTRSEWRQILESAGIHNYTITWKWAFRWQIVIPAYL